MIAPLAMIFGKQYLKLLQNESKIKILETEEKALESEIVRQEEEVKHWTYKELATQLVEIQKGLELILVNPNVPIEEKIQLKNVFWKIYKVFESSRQLDEKVEA